MKISNYLASVLTTMTFIVCVAPAVLAQEFLNPIAVQPPTFLQNGTVNSTAAQGAINNSTNLLTGPGAYKAAVPNGRQFSLASSGNGLLAPNSVNNTPFKSGSYSYGFQWQGAPINLPNHYGNYNGLQLPQVSTASVDLNIVDCSNLAQYYSPGMYNPYGLNDVLQITNPDGSLRIIDFQQTAQEASSFMQMSLEDLAN